MGRKFLFGMMKKFWRMGTGGGYTVWWLFLVPLNCKLESGKSGKFYVYCTTVKSKYQKEQNDIELIVCHNMSFWKKPYFLTVPFLAYYFQAVLGTA